MCLAPEVDVVAGAAIAVVAVDALRHNNSRRTLPLALLPAIFALHTFASAFVWWGLRGSVPAAVGEAATDFFMFVAFVLLPVYVPISVLLLEPRGWRQFALTALAGAGALSSVEYLDGLLSGRAGASACDFYIDYSFVDAPTYTAAAYFVATVGALLLSGERSLMLWGVLNAVAVVLLVATVRTALPSLWCFWAACTSVFVAWYLRRLRRRRESGEPWPWETFEPLPELLNRR